MGILTDSICVHSCSLSYSCLPSEKLLAQGFGLCWRFPLSSCHSGLGSLPEFRGQASAISKDAGHIRSCKQKPPTTSSTASTSTSDTTETQHSHAQRYLLFFPLSARNLALMTCYGEVRIVLVTLLPVLTFCSSPKTAAKGRGGWTSVLWDQM